MTQRVDANQHSLSTQSSAGNAISRVNGVKQREKSP